ncbi:MAG TPA: VWA domain-containing protein [Blastocatellia bacterium]|nr:VWA domain-containing protein [Blastocatellia bacterium]
MTHPSTEDGLIINTILLCRALRERNLLVTPSEVVDAVATLSLIDLDDRHEIFLSLRSVLTSRVEDFPVFEELFESFWDRLDRGRQPRKIVENDSLSKGASQVRLSSREHGHKGLAFFLEHWGAESRDITPIKLPGASNVGAAAEKDFSMFGTDELEEISRLARRIAKRLARNRSRRWEPVRRGAKVDLRRALRHSLRTGGELVELSFKQRKQKKTRLVVICDVSGSMDIYSQILLQFVYGLQNSFARVETFVFSTTLERITGHLRDRDFKHALKRMGTNVRGWSGGTLIGASITAFNSGWPKLVDKRAVVIILSDGWDTGEPEELSAALADLKRRAGKLIWLNPLLGSQAYRPLVRGMQAALPHLDVFAPLHNLASLRALERHLIL